VTRLGNSHPSLWRPITLAVVALLVAVAASIGRAAGTVPGTVASTAIFSASGKKLGTVVPYSDSGPVGKSASQWTYGASLECYVWKERGRYDVFLTHNSIGAAVRHGAARWFVWTGERFKGTIKEVSQTRANLYRRGGGGHLVAFTRGPDGVAAGAAYLALGVCD
jgi:hypothetical protein